MGNADASDGLKLGDVSELVISEDGKKQDVFFENVPVMIVVRAALSKTRNKYVTFLPKEGCEYVLVYLRKRIAQGEILHADSPVIALKKGYEHKGNFKRRSQHHKDHQNHKLLTTPRITAEIRETQWSITSVRPYVLRAYFDTQLLLAESNGKMTHAYRQFFMGHKGDIEARYTTNKGRLNDEMVADMRRAFLQSREFLCTDQTNNLNSQTKRRCFLRCGRNRQRRMELIQINSKL